MLRRCGDPQSTQYALYGGRGVTVCKRWRKYENFLADMGAREAGMTLGRKNPCAEIPSPPPRTPRVVLHLSCAACRSRR